MRNLNEAMRILSKANARRFLESKSLSKFINFEDVENADFNSKTPKNKKETHVLGYEANNVIHSCIYSNDKRIKKTFQKFSKFNPELSQLKTRFAKIPVPISQAPTLKLLGTQEHSKVSDVFKRFRDSFRIKYFGNLFVFSTVG